MHGLARLSLGRLLRQSTAIAFALVGSGSKHHQRLHYSRTVAMASASSSGSGNGESISAE